MLLLHNVLQADNLIGVIPLSAPEWFALLQSSADGGSLVGGVFNIIGVSFPILLLLLLFIIIYFFISADVSLFSPCPLRRSGALGAPPRRRAPAELVDYLARAADLGVELSPRRRRAGCGAVVSGAASCPPSFFIFFPAQFLFIFIDYTPPLLRYPLAHLAPTSAGTYDAVYPIEAQPALAGDAASVQLLRWRVRRLLRELPQTFDALTVECHRAVAVSLA